jgi:HSP20 family protein
MFLPQVRTMVPTSAPSWTMDRLFEDFFSDFPFRESATSVFPAWNVSEDEKGFSIEAELPGFSRDEIEISVVGDELRLSGTRKVETKDDKANYHRRERFTGSFSRSLRLGVPIEADKVEASFKDGILTVALPKSEAALPRKIRVKAA